MAPTMPTRIGGTRWLSHTLLALENLWKGYRGIVQHLDQVKMQALQTTLLCKHCTLKSGALVVQWYFASPQIPPLRG